MSRPENKVEIDFRTAFLGVYPLRSEHTGQWSRPGGAPVVLTEEKTARTLAVALREQREADARVEVLREILQMIQDPETEKYTGVEDD